MKQIGLGLARILKMSSGNVHVKPYFNTQWVGGGAIGPFASGFLHPCALPLCKQGRIWSCMLSLMWGSMYVM